MRAARAVVQDCFSARQFGPLALLHPLGQRVLFPSHEVVGNNMSTKIYVRVLRSPG